MISRFSDEHTERISVKNRLNKRKFTLNYTLIPACKTAKPLKTRRFRVFSGAFMVACHARFERAAFRVGV